MTDLLLDEEVLTILEDEVDEVCEWEKCQQTRTHLVICPRCRAAENLCEEHATMVKTAPRTREMIFNRTCFHTVFMFMCGKIRVK